MIEAFAFQKYYEKSKEKLRENGTLDQLRQTVKDAMSPNNTRDEFRRLLKADGIDAIFHINPVGRIYGVTFIDYSAGIVTNGSFLGKEFSTNDINERYPALKKEERHAAEQYPRQKHEVRSHEANPLSGIDDTVLDLADTRAYDERQRLILRRKTKRTAVID